MKLTIAEAAARVNRSARTIRRWVHDGHLRQFPSGKVDASHVVEVDRVMRERVGRPKGSSLTVPLVMQGREVGRLTIRSDGEISGRIES
jgi:hypothetical protein